MVFVFLESAEKPYGRIRTALLQKMLYEYERRLRWAACAALLKGSGKKGSMYYNLFDEFLF